MSPDPDIKLAEHLFTALRDASTDGKGVTRDAYGQGEQTAHTIISNCAKELGLLVNIDGSGNLYLTLPGKDRSRPMRMTGSHLDSVPVGGNFDGAAGVIAGLAVLAGWRAAGYVPAVDVTVMGIRAEESTWFPYSYLGSKAAFGLVDNTVLDLRRADTGRTLRDHMVDLGLDPGRFGRPALNAEGIDRFIELHIEQGPKLVNAKVPVGIVTGIRGSFRYRDMRWLGKYAHSGAVDRRDRSDAVRAAAVWMAGIDAEWEALDEAGEDLVVTVGKLATNPTEHAFSKVAGELDCCIDVRSISEEVLDRYDQILRAKASTVCQRTATKVEFGQKTGSRPALMHPGLVGLLGAYASTRGINAMDMPSGAGHDAAVFANLGVKTAMIFVRNEHGSHNPDEAMALDDFALAARLLADGLADDR
ncbi:Zn-dependent hydrolase [Bordetella sp. N]|uniref:Zn-dependent hydrolase n=1 Tax=Bordetella sp. N TaxID=1746199 RepID=UPI00070A0789|nr:Zn-dependent hydrolase [Bordetella sp. N]ALM83536.1 Zn-dependent hydrolase [Bordetella sp. N]